MRKIFQIGIKDLLIIFRDRAALTLMLVAPFVLTMGMGLVTGSFSQRDNSANIERIPIVVVNEDDGELGQALVDVFQSEDLLDLVDATLSESSQEARAQVDNDEITAVVLIPAQFSDSIFPDQDTGETAPVQQIELYTNPARPVGSSIIEAILTEFMNRVNAGQVSGRVTVIQLLSNGLIAPTEVRAFADQMGEDLANSDDETQLISLQKRSSGSEEDADEDFNPLAILAPGMAIFFLMYTVTLGGRNFLDEWERGTLPRILTTPTSMVQVIGGKMLGTFLTGCAQVGILVLASRLLFRLNWGDPLGVALLVFSVVAAATGWGMLLTAVTQTPQQVSTVGSALMLLFGILGGSIVSINYTGIMNVISHLTPNAWATDGFTRLANGGTVADILPIAGPLLLMATLLLAVTNFLFRRRWG